MRFTSAVHICGGRPSQNRSSRVWTCEGWLRLKAAIRAAAVEQRVWGGGVEDDAPDDEFSSCGLRAGGKSVGAERGIMEKGTLKNKSGRECACGGTKGGSW